MNGIIHHVVLDDDTYAGDSYHSASLRFRCDAGPFRRGRGESAEHGAHGAFPGCRYAVLEHEVHGGDA